MIHFQVFDDQWAALKIFLGLLLSYHSFTLDFDRSFLRIVETCLIAGKCITFFIQNFLRKIVEKFLFHQLMVIIFIFKFLQLFIAVQPVCQYFQWLKVILRLILVHMQVFFLRAFNKLIFFQVILLLRLTFDVFFFCKRPVAILIFYILYLYPRLILYVLLTDSLQNAFIIRIFIDNIYFLSLLSIYSAVLVLKNDFFLVYLRGLLSQLLKFWYMLILTICDF